ncbi:MAG: MerR family transcriptional regulator [Desulfobacterales bacterium]|nr:MerR family transcriptional regulator [Desulfobacterales bacterium]
MNDTTEFRIQEVSKKLRLPRSTIRYWEMEFPRHIQPRRTNGGQRRYTAENISVLEEIKRLRKTGMSLAEIKRKLGNSGKAKRDHANSNKIDVLAQRVAEVVKAEVSRFFEREEE